MRLQEVWIRYGTRSPWVVREATLTIDPGEIVVVLGHNGAGKSTLLGAAAGVLPVSRGAVRERARVVGWVPERFPAAQPFTARAYLMMMARLRGLTKPAAVRAVESWAQRLHLTPFMDSKLHELSKGSAQKVGLTQALLVPPGLLVLDEPWEGLDALARAIIPETIAEVVDAGGSVLVSDHRGEAIKLPGASRWTIENGLIEVTRGEPAARSHASEANCVIEIGVPASRAEAVAARLRAEGHRVLAVRK